MVLVEAIATGTFLTQTLGLEEAVVVPAAVADLPTSTTKLPTLLDLLPQETIVLVEAFLVETLALEESVVVSADLVETTTKDGTTTLDFLPPKGEMNVPSHPAIISPETISAISRSVPLRLSMRESISLRGQLSLMT